MNSLTLRGPLGWSLASITFILVFCIYAIITVSTPLLQPGNTENAASKTEPLVDQYNEFVKVDIARFNGRSAFFKPIRIIVYREPPPPPPPPPPTDEEEPEVDPVPFVDPVYRGPTLIAIIGDEAWFRGSGTGPDSVIRLRIGDEQNGLTLVKTTLPSIVTVQYRGGGPYDINLFTTDEPFFRQDPPPVTAETFLEAVEG